MKINMHMYEREDTHSHTQHLHVEQHNMFKHPHTVRNRIAFSSVGYLVMFSHAYQGCIPVHGTKAKTRNFGIFA